jgi:AcrR family transcriptional regulator
MTDGLESVTLRSVSEAVGITGGLVGHYFPAVDELLAEVFSTAAGREIDDLLATVHREQDPLDSLRTLLRLVVSDERDPVTLLWIDAWHAGRRRPAVRREVNRLSTSWMELITTLVVAGRTTGQFTVVDPLASATRILAVIDAHGLQSVMREAIDYGPVRELVGTVTEHELGLAPGALDLGRP